MTEKRYYEKNWEESYYIFDSKTLSESEFDERVDYEGYDVFGDSLTGSEIIDLLNENEQLKNIVRHDYEEHKRCVNNYVDKIKEVEKENEQLTKELKIYRKLASCKNCEHHSYDWFDDGDEFEVCDKGNNVTEGICKDWEEIE